MANPTLVTDAASEPFTTAEAKAHLRVDHANDDSLIDDIVKGVRTGAEAMLGRALINATFDWYRDSFPGGEFIALPGGRLVSITSLKYTDSDDSETTWAAANYFAVTSHEPGRLHRAWGVGWPSVTLKPADGVVVRYIAGYGSASSNIPQDIRDGMKLWIAHLYFGRGDVANLAPGQVSTDIPKAARALLWPHRLFNI